jgi:hypothetical protein
MNAQAESVLKEPQGRIAAEHRAAPGGITTRVIRTLPEIEEIRPVWENWSNHPNSDIDFFLMNLRNEPGNPRPHIIVVYRRGRPECILVGRIARRPIEFKIGYKTLFKPEARVIAFVYAGLLGNVDAETGCHLVDDVLACLKKGEAEAAFFMLLRRDAPLLELLTRRPPWSNRDHFISLQPHRGMTLPASADEFHQNLSTKVRKNQKWQSRKFLEEYAGDVAIKCVQSITELQSAIQDIEGIATKTYQRRLDVGFVDSPAMRERLSFEARQGWLRIYLLYAGGKPCAFWIGTVYKETFHSAFMGFDPWYARHSPGMFLIMHVLESLCDSACKDVREIDFGHGDAQYKAVLANREWEEAPVYLFAPNIRGVRLALLRASAALVNDGARTLLAETGLLAKAKKVWRQRVRQIRPSAKPTVG